MSSAKLSPMEASSEAVKYLWRRPKVGTFYVRVRVPPSLGIGTHLQESLKTKDEREALRRLPVVAGRLLAERERLSRQADGAPKRRPPAPPKEAARWAEWWRQKVIEHGGDPDNDRVPVGLQDQLDNEIERRLGRVLGEAEDTEGHLQPVYDENAELEAIELAEVAQGMRRPIASELDRYLTEQRLKPRYESRGRLAIKRLVAWRRGRPGGDDLRRIDRREAGLFVDHLLALGMTTATANSLSSSLSAYWRWMERRGAATGNPWRDQHRKATDEEAERKVRAFTAAEAKALLSGETNRTLHDLMRVAALSGMRINEICNLTVADTVNDLFNVRVSKTAAGVRRVPIHPLLAALVARRSEGKAAGDYLFNELKAPASRPKERSAKASERFTEYRRLVGIDERSEGQRNSSVNFHSWRHRFVTQALQAGHPKELVGAVVGHETWRTGVTLQVYDSGPSEAQLKAVVEAVGLPDDVPVESPPGPLMNEGARKPKTGKGSPGPA